MLRNLTMVHVTSTTITITAVASDGDVIIVKWEQGTDYSGQYHNKSARNNSSY